MPELLCPEMGTAISGVMRFAFIRFKEDIFMKGKSGLCCMLPSLLVVIAVGFTLNTGLTSPKALTADVSASAATVSHKTSVTKNLKTASSSGSTSSYKASGDLSKCSDGTFYGSARGFAGNIKVRVVIKDHKLMSIKVVSVEGDGSSYVARAKKVIARILKKQSLDVDTVSGATYSSNGIIKAVENAIKKASGKSVKSSGKKTGVKHDSSLNGAQFKDGTYTGTGKGFRGNITLQVTISSGKISQILIAKNEADDSSYFEKASQGVIPKIINKQSTVVDAVSGATYSSNGIIKAVENALKKALVKTNSDSSDSSDSDKKTDPVTPTDPDTPDTPVTPTGKYSDGTYEGFARGFDGFMYVSVVIQSGKIASIDITQTNDNEPYLSDAKTLIDVIIQKQTTDGISAVSGATYSSNGILNSVKKALAKATPETSGGTN